VGQGAGGGGTLGCALSGGMEGIWGGEGAAAATLRGIVCSWGGVDDGTVGTVACRHVYCCSVCIILSVCAHSPPFSLCLLHCGCRVLPVHTGSRLDGLSSSSASTSASASDSDSDSSYASASADSTAAKSTLQVNSLSLATQACLAPAGTLGTCRSVKLCDSYDDN
jgi:hypothetical protein